MVQLMWRLFDVLKIEDVPTQSVELVETEYVKGCEVPICRECEACLKGPWDIFQGTVAQPPARALSNDMVIFYAPKSIYEEDDM